MPHKSFAGVLLDISYSTQSQYSGVVGAVEAALMSPTVTLLR